MQVYEITTTFPAEEKYSMVDQMRRSSRSVCANIAEAWRRRRYRPAFVAKLNDAESEASETQVWLEFARRCGYLKPEAAAQLAGHYDLVLGQLVRMIDRPDAWIVRPSAPREKRQP